MSSSTSSMYSCWFFGLCKFDLKNHRCKGAQSNPKPFLKNRNLGIQLTRPPIFLPVCIKNLPDLLHIRQLDPIIGMIFWREMVDTDKTPISSFSQVGDHAPLCIGKI